MTSITARAEKSRIAVVDAVGIFTEDGEIILGELVPGVNAADAVGACRDLGVRQLWFTPSAIRALGLPRTLGRIGAVIPEWQHHPFLECARLRAPGDQDQLRSWLSYWDDAGFVELAFPSWDRQSPFYGVADPEVLLRELIAFKVATGMLWRRSGAITSDAWLRNHYGTKLKSTEYPDVARETNLEPDLHYHRPPVDAELRAQFLYAFDISGMYLGAASSLALPEGQFLHIGADDERRSFRSSEPGYWHAPIAQRGEQLADLWMTSPSAAYFADWYSEGYYWPNHRRWLEPWYKVLRDARAELMASPHPVALAAVKAVYRMGIGRLGSERRQRFDDPLYQPYWRHAVQAEARTRLERKIAALPQAPVAVDVDCLYFLSNYTEPGRLAARLGLEISSQLGKFQIHGRGSGREARSLLLAADATEAEIFGGLRGLTK